MKIKTSELTDVALDWAVMTCGLPDGRQLTAVRIYGGDISYQPTSDPSIRRYWRPSEDWAQGGPIIEREDISVIRCDDDYEKDSRGFTTTKRLTVWFAEHGGGHSSQNSYGSQGDFYGMAFHIDEGDGLYGPTPLIAAMRCYVASKLGDEIEIPEELA